MMSTTTRTAAIAARLAGVGDRIAAAAERAGREPSAVTLVAVSKGFDAATITAAVQAGQADFGENKVQELRGKADQVEGVRWHFIGRLQRNKVKDLVQRATLIHSVDRLSLAEELSARVQRLERLQRVLVQVNADDDPAKAGCSIAEAPDLVGAVRDLDGLACEGLMTIPAAGTDPRPAFARLRQLRNDLRSTFPEVQHLSMGMTNDFEVAVEEGATIVRVGQAIFGPRPDAVWRPPVVPAGLA